MRSMPVLLSIWNPDTVEVVDGLGRRAVCVQPDGTLAHSHREPSHRGRIVRDAQRRRSATALSGRRHRRRVRSN